MYAPDKAVLSISNIMSLTGLTKYMEDWANGYGEEENADSN